MANFDPRNYATVDDRIAEFYREHPEGSIRTRLVRVDGGTVIFEARIYRDLDEAERGIYTSGWAHEVEGRGPINKTNHVENAETSAVGRALANLGYSGSINGKRAPRPSREEMEQAQERASIDRGPASTPREMVDWIRRHWQASDPVLEFSLDGKVFPVKSWIKENWNEIARDYGLAARVVESLEPVVGERFGEQETSK